MLRSDGALCVTFVNAGLGKREPLATYDDLLAWGVGTGALEAADAARLEQAANEQPGPAEGVARRARTLRGRLERILAAVAGGERAAAGDLATLNLELAAALGHRRLAIAGGRFRWTWQADSAEDLDRMLWPVLLSAGEMLVSEDRRRLRRCPSPGCGLFFVARSSGRPRKWCGRACRDQESSRKHYRKIIKPERQKLAGRMRARQQAGLAGHADS